MKVNTKKPAGICVEARCPRKATFTVKTHESGVTLRLCDEHFHKAFKKVPAA